MAKKSFPKGFSKKPPGKPFAGMGNQPKLSAKIGGVANAAKSGRSYPK